ncbi:hypothetical protein UA08_09489 [Talaromyces atroroseus]|uniref:AAA+ ATPase domain-containing protein n=1 Tax=Talaromyces atroroseus TaxID=1441469 RepID=A0A1Q5Q601_TALAT|nr:hypothetical protein UA08_09489 [Talaromyces atroroseus]OKL55245.1 hypothetical protein UA08_09489 [Talaromyces atroroseus]
MASSSQKQNALSSHAQVTPPDSPNHELPFKDVKRGNCQLLLSAIHGVLSEMKAAASPAGSHIPPNGDVLEHLETIIETMATPSNDGSEPVTINQLIQILEAAMEQREQLRSADGSTGDGDHREGTSNGIQPLPSFTRQTQLPASLERLLELFSQFLSSKSSLPFVSEHPRPALAVDTSGAYVNEKFPAWDDRTEIDNSSKVLYRVSKAGFESVPMEAVTPPNSPQMVPSGYITKEELKWLFTEALGIKNAQPTSDGKDSTSNKAAEDQDNIKVRVRASKVEYKTVNEVWDSAKYEYKTVDSTPVPDIDELDEYIFVIRKRSHKQTKELIVYVDIKSPGLREILKEVLKDIKTANLDADRPAIERDLLYHFMDGLREYQKKSHAQETISDDAMLHLSKLVQYLEETYASVIEQLKLLLESRKITWDVLWALLKPGSLVFATCPSTGLPRCIRYDYSEKKTIRGREILEINGRYLDYDGEIFGESTETLQIESFRGIKRIETLPVFPLKYHSDPKIWSRLVRNGRRFVSLIGSHHRQYSGNMFVPNKTKLLKLHVNGRIMVDAAIFRKSNPNYPRLEIKKPDMVDFFFEQVKRGEPEGRVRSKDVDFRAMKEEDLAMCSPTVLGFSLNEKIWGEFDVDSITEISFSNAPFDMLTVPEEKKKVIKSLAESRVCTKHEGATVDDVIVGKGQGVIILLHGPPGVGKTLTAEAISERLQRPLYSISSGDLSIRAEELEAQLTRTFQVASDWKAVLLLDEADVYLQKRDGFQLERNRLVATFLRTLEYYDGIFFLTTNMLGDFDSAILDRIQLKLRYDDLDPSARKSVFQHFLGNLQTDIEEKSLLQFSEVQLNGRQIAHNVALSENKEVSTSHLRLALTQSGYSIPTQGALTTDDSLYQC